MSSGNVEERIEELEKRLEELKARWPKHSVPPSMMAELEELEEELEMLRAQARARRKST